MVTSDRLEVPARCLPRDQVPIASNILIDGDGVIRFYSLLDTTKFDAKLVALKQRLDQMLAAGKR